MTETLAEKTCTPCRGGIPPLTRDEAQRLQAQARDWQLADDAHRIERTFRFRYFRESLAFVQEVGELAETEGWSPTCELWNLQHRGRSVTRFRPQGG